MILFISDIHCSYDLINQQIRHAEATAGEPIESVVVVGDLGLFASHLHSYFQLRKERFIRPVAFIEGNHEEFEEFDDLTERYSEHLTHLPRGSVQRVGGFRVLCIGGTKYMDAMTTPRRAEVTDADIDQALSHPADGVDVVISHDCPAGIGVRNTSGFEHYGPPGLDRGLEIARRYQPRLWIFGHHHKWHRHEDEHTRYFGLSQGWNGYGLMKKDGSFSIVEHHLEYKRPSGWSWLTSILGLGSNQ